MNIIQALKDKSLFGGWIRDPETFQSWFVFLKALFALKPTDEDLVIYRKHTGRSEWPTKPAKEAWVIAGRRAGKSLVAGLVAAFLACFRDHGKSLAPGEVVTIPVLAADRRQARVVMRFIDGLISNIPMLAAMVTARTQESIEFSNRAVIEVHTCSFRSVRGYSLGTAICDEIAFWRSDESANPDKEILNALRPGLATSPGSMLLCISSPYARRGALWEAFRKHYGKDGDPVLVWQADTLSMNPTIDPSVIEQAMEDDESAARAEYLAEFRTDIESFIDRETVEKLIVPGRVGLPYMRDVQYTAFCDPSGGSSDSFTLAIAHMKDDVAVLDCLLESKPPFSPEATVKDFCATLAAYRIDRITGDRYGAEWPVEQFRKWGVSYETSEKTKSELYQEMLPRLNSGRVELLENRHMVSQLCGLERRTARSGRDSIDHSPGMHDDLANAVAGALVTASAPRNYTVVKKLQGF